MKKFVLILLLSVLFTNAVFAEEFTISVSETIIFKQIPVKLINVGSLGSALLNVDETEVRLSKNKPIESDITIELLESDPEFIKIDIQQNVACLIDEDCDDNSPCSQGTCNVFRECVFNKVNGCELGNDCKPAGTFGLVENKLSYCSQDFNWENRKDYNEHCLVGYECISTLCESNKCTQPVKKINGGGEKMAAPLWLTAIFGIIFLIIGLIVLFKPQNVKDYIREVSYKRESSIKIIGIVALLLGIVLVIITFYPK